MRRPEELSHIIPCTARAVLRNSFRALCGTLVYGWQHVASNPTCEDCKAIDEEDARQLQSLMAMPAAENPVRSTYGNPLTGYRPKGSRR